MLALAEENGQMPTTLEGRKHGYELRSALFPDWGESQEVIPDHHCPLPMPAPDGSQIYQFTPLIQQHKPMAKYKETTTNIFDCHRVPEPV